MKEMFNNMQNGGCKQCGCSSDSRELGNQQAALDPKASLSTGCTGAQAPDDSENTGGLGSLANCNQVLMESIGLARAYVPYQTVLDIMSEEKSLACGTIFADLSMPYKKGTRLANS